MENQFLKDVIDGLSSNPKRLSSRYFYDEIGDTLFQQIMELPEYYLTRSELEIFQTKCDQFIKSTSLDKTTYFELVDLGAGDATKTKEFIKYLHKKGFSFSYVPVDISRNALNNLKTTLSTEFPELRIQTELGDYFEVLNRAEHNLKPKVVLFLGSNIGNLTDEQAHDFLSKLSDLLLPQDFLILGVDLIKPRSIVLPAYNDSQNITAEFNLNLLVRMNKELQTNFKIENFKHVPKYSEETGIAESFLESNVDQTIQLNGGKKEFHFRKGERIHTEISRKYNDEILNQILKNTHFEIVKKITDSQKYFANFVLKITK